MVAAPALEALTAGPLACGHDERHNRAYFLDGDNAGQRWCLRCVRVMQRCQREYGAGRMSIDQVAEQLRGLDTPAATEEAIADFCRELMEETRGTDR